ncbi:hypothetical protein [Pedobacter panaciterrae]
MGFWKNYAIGLRGKKLKGRLDGKESGEWEGLNQSDLEPSSLFKAQLKARSTK